MRRQLVIGAALLVAVAQSVAGAPVATAPGVYTELRAVVTVPTGSQGVDVLTVPGFGVIAVRFCSENNESARLGVGRLVFRNTTTGPLMYFTYEADDFSTDRTSRREDGLLKPNAEAFVLAVFSPFPFMFEVNAGEATIVNPNDGLPVTVFTSAASLVDACHFEVRVLIPTAKFKELAAG